MKGIDINMNNVTILVVDDESRMRKLIKDFLAQKGYSILEAVDGEDALRVFTENQNQINLILLDVMMPKLDGWSVLRQIRQTSKVPIIMLTARGEEQDELFGFELGVDEYIAKPFSPKILVARVEVLLKRTMGDKNEVKDYGGITIDPEGRTVKVDGKAVELSLREYELLKYLVDNENIALSRDKILNNVWNYDYYGEEIPQGFSELAKSGNTHYCAIADCNRQIYALQFHPEVVHSECGGEILKNFAVKICHANTDWNMKNFIAYEIEKIRKITGLESTNSQEG